MGKIGDLFVKLGLKNQDFKQGMQEAKTEVTTFGSKMQGVGKVAVTAWAAVSAAVIAFARDAVRMTQKWGDTWAITMEGVKAAYGTFVRQISSGEGWDNLLANMAESYRVAKEIASAMDELFERKVSYSIEEAEMQKQISELQLIMRDSSKSDAEREAAGKKILDLEDKLGQKKQEIWNDEADYYKRAFQNQTKLNDEQTQFLVDNYNKNRQIINDSRKYLEERQAIENKIASAKSRVYSGGVAGTTASQEWADAMKELEDFDNATSQAIRDVAELTKRYDRSSDELVQGMVQSKIAAINVGTEINRMKLRPTAMLGTLANRSDSELAGVESETKTETGDPMLGQIRDEIETLRMLADETAEVEAASDSMIESWRVLHGLTPLEDLVDPDLADVIEEADKNVVQLGKDFQETSRWSVDMGELLAGAVNSAVQGFSDAMQEMFDQIFAMDDLNGDAIFAALLKPLAETAKKMGEIMLAAGIGMTAFGKALTNPTNAPMLIAAGAALVAIGAAASAALSSLAANGSSSATTTTGTSMAAATTSSAELTVYVKGTIKGSDILISGQNTMNEWSK